jgi:hypothetical protein
MGRSNSASTILQADIAEQHGHLSDAEQIKGIYSGTVLQTDASIDLGSASPIPKGMMTINLPDIGSNHVSEPLAYPGSVAPPIGTNVSVGFDANHNPVVLTIYGFNPTSDLETLIIMGAI